jgi:hypothetical protein
MHELGPGGYSVAHTTQRGAFAVIEAANIEAAVSVVSTTLCAVAHGVVEVWPIQSTREPQ